MKTSLRSRLAIAVAGAGLAAGYAAAGDCPPGHHCPDKKVYPKYEHFYIKKFCGPTIAPGSCFGYFKPKTTPWEVACPGACDPHESVYPSTGPTPPNAQPDVAPTPEPTTKPVDPKTPESAKPVTPPKATDKPVETAPLPKPPTVPLVDPKKEKDGGKSSRLNAPRIILPPAPATPVTATVTIDTPPTLLPPVVRR
jgi:hypothetical protein